MELGQFLICLASRHEQTKDSYEEELKDLWKNKKKRGGRHTEPSFDDERSLMKEVVNSVRAKPACLKKLSPQALGCLAYLFRCKMQNDPFTEGHEIIAKLVCDPEHTIDYLKGFAELKELGWIRFLETPSGAFTDQEPFCWLQTSVEFGDTFQKNIGEGTQHSQQFTSNDAYLDAVINYLKAMISDDGSTYRVTEHGLDLYAAEPFAWYRRISMRVQASTIALPSAQLQHTYKLSIYQFLNLIGLLALREGDLRYDFSDTNDVTRLFAKGRICRKEMQEHLYGEKSPLKQSRLIESSHGSFGESVQLSQTALTALIGKQETKKCRQELEQRVKKKTFFDYEEPKVKKDSVMLPVKTMETIKSILFSESYIGKRIRKGWHATLPAAWGSPTGTTVLLYGPPGTGKTLTAQYIASELKQPLLKIDAAKVLSCWVSESEKHVKRVFDDYSMLQKEFGKSPVLLLNEADQLLGNRGTGTSSVDRMHNNLQNLFLEGLERFSGVLVATTNRRELLDAGFSRRFTYKLELPPPDRLLRMELWKNHLPEKRLEEDVDIGQLADLGLTGGEIRLVVERAVRIAAYRGQPKISHATLKEIAHEELNARMKQFGSTRKIGFDITSS